jgi:hypothetical protein
MQSGETPQRAVHSLQLPAIQDVDVQLILKTPLTAEETYDAQAQLYVVTCPQPYIAVWNKNRTVAHEAFHFAFLSLVRNFYHEKDEKLTNKARHLKKKLGELIEEI